MTLEDYKITDGLTIHLVKGGGNKPAVATGQTASAGTTASAPTQAPNVSNPTGAGAGGMPAGFPGMPGMAGMGGMPGMGGMGGMPGMPGMGAGGMPNPQMM